MRRDELTIKIATQVHWWEQDDYENGMKIINKYLDEYEKQKVTPILITTCYGCKWHDPHGTDGVAYQCMDCIRRQAKDNYEPIA